MAQGSRVWLPACSHNHSLIFHPKVRGVLLDLYCPNLSHDSLAVPLLHIPDISNLTTHRCTAPAVEDRTAGWTTADIPDRPFRFCSCPSTTPSPSSTELTASFVIMKVIFQNIHWVSSLPCLTSFSGTSVGRKQFRLQQGPAS